MTQEIIEMARDSGMELYGLGKDRARFVHHLEAFAKLVAEKALAEHAMRETQRLGQEIEQEPLEYWNAVEGWVKIDEVREHFETVGCATIYKTAGEGRVPLSLAKAQPEQEPVALPCCGYTDASAVKWNPFNNVVQCHNCGQVYTTPPQRKPLTHKEIWNAIRPLTQSDAVCMSLVQISMDEYRAIEAAHDIKENT